MATTSIAQVDDPVCQAKRFANTGMHAVSANAQVGRQCGSIDEFERAGRMGACDGGIGLDDDANIASGIDKGGMQFAARDRDQSAVAQPFLLQEPVAVIAEFRTLDALATGCNSVISADAL